MGSRHEACASCWRCRSALLPSTTQLSTVQPMCRRRRLAAVATHLQPAAAGGQATVGVLGLPSDTNSSFMGGPAGAPPAIRAGIACDSANSFAELGEGFGDVTTDLGDVALGDGASAADCDEVLYAAVASRVLRKGLSPLCFGGDHSVTFPAFRAVATHCRGELMPASLRKLPLCIVHFDAHPDLYEDVSSFMGETNPFSHASPFARIMESGQCHSLIQLGCRTVNPHQRAQRDRYGVTALDASWLHGIGREDLWDWLDAQLPDECLIYVTIDIDAIDPGEAPGVSHYEPGGMTVRSLLSVLQALVPLPEVLDGAASLSSVPAPPWAIKSRRFTVGADIVELNPVRDPEPASGQPGRTAMVAAKLAKELAALLHRSRIAMGH